MFFQLSWLDHLEGKHVFWLPDSLEFGYDMGRVLKNRAGGVLRKKTGFRISISESEWLECHIYVLKKLIISGSLHLPYFLFEMNDHHCLQPDFF